jgi:hypothetical protein
MKKIHLIAAMAAALLCSTSAHAIDFTQTIKTFDGKEFIDNDGKPVPIVLGTVIENSLLAAGQNDPIEEKNRFWLALKIHEKAKNYAPTPDEIVLIKKALTVQPLTIMGQAIRIIDPTYVPSDK